MDNYEILGVDKDSSMEEIKNAYETKIKQIDNEVSNKKNAEAFKKVLKDAYDSLITDNSNENTLIMTKEEFEELSKKEEEEYYDDYGYDDYDYYDEDEYEEDRRRRKERNKREKRRKRQKRNRDKDYEDERDRRYDSYNEEREDFLPWYIKLPLKILALPFVIIFSVILFIFDIINAALWAVTKILIVASIVAAGGLIYLYYNGMLELRTDLLTVCGAVFLVSIILPAIVKAIPKPLQIINNKLKAFVF